MTNQGEAREKWVPELNFGARLALVRHRMGWNIKEAAQACGLPAQSWRGWELNGREPHRLVTVAMAIATRTGVDLDWLVYGPEMGRTGGTHLYVADRPRVLKTMCTTGTDEDRSAVHSGHLTRPVRQTRPAVRQGHPLVGGSNRPFTPVAV